MPDVFNAAPEPEKTVQLSPVEQKEIEKRHFHNPFRSYIHKPHWVNFETKYDHETVHLLLRRHIVTNVPWILVALLLILAPLLLDSFPIFAFLPANFKLIAVISWYLIVFAFVLENFLVWFFNVGIVTNIRLVDIDFLNLLVKEVSDAEIDQIQDVTYKMNGAIRSIFNYGDVYVQTASEKPNIEFMAVPSPDKIVKVLQQLREHHFKGKKI